MASIIVEIKKNSKRILGLIKNNKETNYSSNKKELETKYTLTESIEQNISSIKWKFYSNCPLKIREFRLLQVYYIRRISNMRFKPRGYKMFILNANEKILRYYLNELKEMGYNLTKKGGL